MNARRHISAALVVAALLFVLCPHVAANPPPGWPSAIDVSFYDETVPGGAGPVAHIPWVNVDEMYLWSGGYGRWESLSLEVRPYNNPADWQLLEEPENGPIIDWHGSLSLVGGEPFYSWAGTGIAPPFYGGDWNPAASVPEPTAAQGVLAAVCGVLLFLLGRKHGRAVERRHNRRRNPYRIGPTRLVVADVHEDGTLEVTEEFQT